MDAPYQNVPIDDFHEDSLQTYSVFLGGGGPQIFLARPLTSTKHSKSGFAKGLLTRPLLLKVHLPSSQCAQCLHIPRPCQFCLPWGLGRHRFHPVFLGTVPYHSVLYHAVRCRACCTSSVSPVSRCVSCVSFVYVVSFEYKRIDS